MSANFANCRELPGAFRFIFNLVRDFMKDERRIKTKTPNPSPTNLRPQNRPAEWLRVAALIRP
jgi:hypothetical protein